MKKLNREGGGEGEKKGTVECSQEETGRPEDQLYPPCWGGGVVMEAQHGGY